MESMTPTEKRYRWWLDPRWIFPIVVVACAGIILWGLFGPEPRLIISRETTYITEPLRPDGTPDYAAYVLDLMGRGTPPEENAAVNLLRATWPMGLDDKGLGVVCSALGMPDTAPDILAITAPDRDQALLDELRVFLKQSDAEIGTRLRLDNKDDERVRTLLEIAQSAPWTSEECRPLAGWVQRLGPALALVTEAAHRPKYVFPPPELLRRDPGSLLFGDMMPEALPIRTACCVVIIRAMLDLGEERTSDAWTGIHAVHRLSRLMAPQKTPRFLIVHAVAWALESAANSATLTLLESPGLSAEMARSIRRDLESLPPLADIRLGFAMERLGMVEIATTWTRLPRSTREGFGFFGSLGKPAWLCRASLDMNLVLRFINRQEDRIEAALSLPDGPSRCRSVDQILTDLDTACVGPSDWAKRFTVAENLISREARSIAVARNLTALFQMARSGLLKSYENQRVNGTVVRIAVALAEYRARGLGGEGKMYPDALDELVPTILDAVPNDPCSEKPFRYERRGEGYLLYSVGTDGVDDGGTNDELDKGEWRSSVDEADSMHKDVVVRLPRPKRSLIPPAHPVNNY